MLQYQTFRLFYGQFLRHIFTLKFALLFLLLCLGALITYCVHLNTIVTDKFEGVRFTVPTRIYARPLELYWGKKWDKHHLIWELQKLHYQAKDKLLAPGDYVENDDEVTIYSRTFDFWDGVQSERKVRLNFSSGFVSTLQDQTTGSDLDYFRLEPVMLTGGKDNEFEDRALITIEQVPVEFVAGLLAIEDQRFFQHVGVDVRSLVRAGIATLMGQGVQGGSTITQQLVKNYFLTPERTIKRKLTEILMAIILDFRYDKQEILEAYLNEVYFGQDGVRAIHGIQLASQYFFGKNIDQLKLHESATLIAMLKGPSYYNPHRHVERTKARRDLVINQMQQQNVVSEEQAMDAQQKKLEVVSPYSISSVDYPAFIDRVYRELSSNYFLEAGEHTGLRIFSTLDPVVQDSAERALTDQLIKLESAHSLPSGQLQGAVVVTVPFTGHIAAIVGDRDPRFDGFNRALDAQRQIGSLIKPAVYLTALEQSDQYSLVSELDDSELEVEQQQQEVWRPQNYDRQHHGIVPFWMALVNSYNIPTVRLGLELGLDKIIKQTQLLGATSTIAPYTSTVLGSVEMSPIEMSQIYQTLASDGVRIATRSILAVTDDNREMLGSSYELSAGGASAQGAYLINRTLQLAVAEGTGKSMRYYLSPDLQIAGKTGTTDELRDSWFVGYNRQWVGVVWVGNDRNKSTELTGASGALTVWGTLFERIGLQTYEPYEPRGVKSYPVNRLSGRRTSSRCGESVSIPFIVGSEPSRQFGCGKSQRQAKEKRGWFRNLFGG